MTVNEAIAALEAAKVEAGGEAPLLMVDGLHVIKFPVGDGCVYVSDAPPPGDEQDEPDDDYVPLAALARQADQEHKAAEKAERQARLSESGREHDAAAHAASIAAMERNSRKK